MNDRLQLNKNKSGDSVAILVRYLRSQAHLLGDISGPNEVVELFDLLANFLQRTPRKKLNALLNKTTRSSVRPEVIDVSNMSLDELDEIVRNPDVVRRTLEQIAVDRFHVPRGSMRSFSTVAILREKLTLLIENSRTHLAIGDIAARGD